MFSMINDLKKNKQKLELKPIIIVAYIIQCIGTLGFFYDPNGFSKYSFWSLNVIFEILGFSAFVEVAFILVLWQYIKFNKNKEVQ